MSSGTAAHLALLLLAKNVAGVIVSPAALDAATGWLHVGDAPTDASVDVLIQVQRQNLDQLERVALAVSTPGHAQFRKYYSSADVAALTAPAEADVAAVRDFIAPAALALTETAGVLRARLHVGRAANLLSTTFRTLRAVHGERRLLRAGSYVLPEGIASKIEAIHGLHGLPLPTPKKAPALPKAGKVLVEAASPPEPPEVVPSVIVQTYGMGAAKASGSATVRQAVAEFQGQTMNQTDVTAFFKKYVPSAAAGDAAVYAFHGEPKKGGDGVEAMLDIEYMMGVAPGLKTEFYEQMSMNFCADLKNWTTLLLATADVPLVHSVSYGWQGNLSQIQCPQAQVASIDADYASLAAKGITIIFASGDSGSGYAPPMPPPPPQCPAGTEGEGFEGTPDVSSNFTVPKAEAHLVAQICCERATMEGLKAYQLVPGPPAPPHPNMPPLEVVACELFKTLPAKRAAPGVTSGTPPPHEPPSPPGPSKAVPLYPSWPASSPWVTAVGATRFHEDKVGNPEAAVSREDHFGSGGGFSRMWDAPAWQTDAVQHYFETVDAATLPNASVASYPRGGRGTPDVAALGASYTLLVRGQKMAGVGGTSASAPVFGAMISLINDALATAGKPAMGFLNPLLYQHPEAFFDVTIGSNKIGRGGAPLKAGFNCSAGWDPVTGLGTPHYEKLLGAAMAA